MNLTGEFTLLLILFIWLLLVSIFFLQFYLKFNRVLKIGDKESVMNLLKQTSEHQDKNKKTIDQLIGAYAKLDKDGLNHIQKIGLVRFNPFKDTGGDQSFILALVDAQDTGVVISSLHTRTGTRWYAKAVVMGKGVEYDLSDDEVKALRGARAMGK